MNPQDAEKQEETLEDLGVLILSDQCDEIEQILTILKYCVLVSVVIVVVGTITGIYVNRLS
jgi:hypothetical protein